MLKPGGQIALLDLLDFMAMDEYLASFHTLDWEAVDRSGLSFWMLPPVRVVTGDKPE